MEEPTRPHSPLFATVQVHVELEIAKDSGKELVEFCRSDVFAYADLVRNVSA